MKYRLRFIFIGLAAFVFAGSFLSVTTAQKRVFSHNTKAHKEGKYQDCSSCHALPTKNWASARSDKQEPFPDVATFPSHTSCFGCHTKDIYSNGGAFCGTCHTVPTMRASGGKGVLTFPIKAHGTQFTTIFPHNVHQDIIASNTKRPDVAVGHFVLAAFTRTLDDKSPQFNNCAICHQTRTELPKFTARKTKALMQPLADASADSFSPKAEFFKDMPTGHASCFTCHFQGLKPSGINCASCHKLTLPYDQSAVVPRYSLKFDHQSTNHANKDCTICHLRITQNSDVAAMKDADVPILACSNSSCHGGAKNNAPKGEDQYMLSSIANETAAREDSVAAKTPVFQCTFCHAPAIGRYPIPVSHRIQ